MKKKQQAKYLDKEWDELTAHLVAFLASEDQEQLHKFRVQIKKIRAMLNLFENTSRQHGLLRNLKPLKKIFGYAGVIRNAYINLQLGKKYQLKNNLFESSQQKIIDESIAEFLQHGDEYSKHIKDAHKKVIKNLTTADDSAIIDYYKNKLEYINVNLEPLKFNEDIHTARKQIKLLVYNYKLAEKELGDDFYFNLKYLDNLQDKIGDWHDNELAVQLFSSPELNDKIIAARIKKKNAVIKRLITTMAKDFLSKANGS